VSFENFVEVLKKLSSILLR